MHGSGRLLRRAVGAGQCPFAFRDVEEAARETSGLGSSHTAPRGAAVPARPPTRTSDIKDQVCMPQWVSRATWQGTRVVVQLGYFAAPDTPEKAQDFRVSLGFSSRCELSSQGGQFAGIRKVLLNSRKNRFAFLTILSRAVHTTEESAEVSGESHEQRC